MAFTMSYGAGPPPAPAKAPTVPSIPKAALPRSTRKNISPHSQAEALFEANSPALATGQDDNKSVR